MDDASKNRSVVFKIFFILASTGLTNGSKLDDLLNDNNLLLYVTIGFLCFSVLFLFFVILFISIVIIRMQKIRKAQKEEDEVGGRISETIIANPNVLQQPPRRSSNANEPTKWERHPNAGKNGGKRLSKGNVPVDHLDYMDLIIMDAVNMNLPRAKKIENENREKTV
ncbi:uncharacterized protein LOC111338848 [Stylophora pistillata]|uniref:Uncharacterized protein n=1 Tax=Stylophora pistillata TaxID=50429 RepID=A0A2B4RRR1_STYPI|nr:uncharacterized protein LOC111338848 [Stylophora pistillata]PFX18945.1 hypothetical protein AWC38_SpisGene16665 [Stylophora pistillata]